MGTHLTTEKLSPFDLMSAILKGGSMDLSNVSSGSGDSPLAALVENRELLMILTTSVVVLIGCVIVLVWRRSAGQKSSKVVEPLKPLTVSTESEPEPEVDDGKTKVVIFFGKDWEVCEVVKEMPCKHRFHGGCIEKWLGSHGSCPVCRFKMPVDHKEVINKSGGVGFCSGGYYC